MPTYREWHRINHRLGGYDYAQEGVYFITICSHQRQCLFGEIHDGQMRLNAAGGMVQENWEGLSERFPFLALDAFVVMPNHLHGIICLIGKDTQTAPATDTPATDTPATDTPATDTPATDTPATDTPATDTPATDTPATPPRPTPPRPTPPRPTPPRPTPPRPTGSDGGRATEGKGEHKVRPYERRYGSIVTRAEQRAEQSVGSSKRLNRSRPISIYRASNTRVGCLSMAASGNVITMTTSYGMNRR